MLDQHGALAEYERALFPRGLEAATEAARDFELRFGDSAPHCLLDLLTGHQPPVRGWAGSRNHRHQLYQLLSIPVMTGR
ncbi:MAG TPA: hypothetical protein VH141_01335 [Pseudonocardia sp.]|nr:hypothetical protein [Pseudonocardia sp.]